MFLATAARQAREHADTCTERGCHAAALALESAVDAAAREQLAEMAPEPDTTGIPPPSKPWPSGRTERDDDSRCARS